MYNFKYGFIGAGNMGGALAKAAAKVCNKGDIYISDADTKKAMDLATALGCNLSTNEEIAKECDYIFLGVKPQVMGNLLCEIRGVLADCYDTPVFISMAAGLSTDFIAENLGEYPIIRIMPNTPAQIGEGMILYTTKDTDDAQVEGFKKAMQAAGTLDFIDEKLIDAASAVSGCGPAFAYMFINALADGGVECGLPRDKALKYAAQTVLGAAGMILKTGEHPSVLKDNVCSPGGTTIAGVHALESNGFNAAAIEAVTAAYKRTLELSGK